jgi:hypothetical protein
MAYQKGTGRPHHLILSINGHSMKQELHLHCPCSRARPNIKHTLIRTSQPIQPNERHSGSSGTYFWLCDGRAVQRVRLFTVQDKVKQMAGMLVSASCSLMFSQLLTQHSGFHTAAHRKDPYCRIQHCPRDRFGTTCQ